MSRSETERQLEASALELLRRDGVLSGLNLREVADNANANRGFVYHYFGSRRDLLRSALRRDARRRLTSIRYGGSLGLIERWTRFFELMTKESEAIRLMTLLVLDGDTEVKIMPLRQEVDARLETEKKGGAMHDDVNIAGAHAAFVSLTWGYVVYRETLAREYEMEAEDLDREVSLVFERFLGGLRSETGGRAAR